MKIDLLLLDISLLLLILLYKNSSLTIKIESAPLFLYALPLPFCQFPDHLMVLTKVFRKDLECLKALIIFGQILPNFFAYGAHF